MDNTSKKLKSFELETSNKFSQLKTPQSQLDVEDKMNNTQDNDNENEDVTAAENRHVTRPPPPITIDKVQRSAELLKKLQELTKQHMKGRVIGKGLRVYPETPEVYHAIRNFIEQNKMESFTYDLDQEKDLKAVIRGMPSDTPPQDIIDDLLLLGITVNVVHVMTNRKTGTPMPLFLVTLRRNDDNRNIFNLTEMCYLKIKVEPLRPKTGPAQCFRCQGFFHSSRHCTRNTNA
ncbi:nucleic-acid-binding protein from transposon X-element [Trichonephila clavata]|uniref:Nucleic-acid-binding protein from transposon X-element n=1 Tax=Trichonephila clavata TaxID=2740835 RepID=A0A8X6IWL0_TRICU|nr:nucleic-acid-binding protein from transposon X-element [Trichonephila clavata]